MILHVHVFLDEVLGSEGCVIKVSVSKYRTRAVPATMLAREQHGLGDSSKGRVGGTYMAGFVNRGVHHACARLCACVRANDSYTHSHKHRLPACLPPSLPPFLPASPLPLNTLPLSQPVILTLLTRTTFHLHTRPHIHTTPPQPRRC